MCKNSNANQMVLVILMEYFSLTTVNNIVRYQKLWVKSQLLVLKLTIIKKSYIIQRQSSQLEKLERESKPETDTIIFANSNF